MSEYVTFSEINAEFDRQAKLGLRAFRPKRNVFLSVAALIVEYGDKIYELTEDRFTGAVMRYSGGLANPETVRLVYRELMEEAGLPEKKDSGDE